MYNYAQGKPGWFVKSIHTDKQGGTLKEFIEKEGKWFNYVRGTLGDNETLSAEFSFQGLGEISTVV